MARAAIVVAAGVICRVGSLENIDEVPSYVGMLVCRTGSLEISLRQVVTSFLVVCRIGSLENNSSTGIRK